MPGIAGICGAGGRAFAPGGQSSLMRLAQTMLPWAMLPWVILSGGRRQNGDID
jgi:hypothetical protein